MTDFTDSPRATKRRRTAVYGSGRSVLEEKQNLTSPAQDSGKTPDSGKGRRTKNALRNGSSPASNISQTSKHVGEEDDHAVSQALPKSRRLRAGGQKSKEAQNGLDSASTDLQTSSHAVDKQVQVQVVAQEDPAVDHHTPPVEDPGTVMESDEEGTSTPQPRSSGRQRTRPRRFSNSPEKPKLKPPIQTSSGSKKKLQKNVQDTLPPTKATPSKSRGGQPRKSVVFDQGEKDIEERFGFRDIDHSSPRSTEQQKSQTKKSPGRNKRKSGEIIVNSEAANIEIRSPVNGVGEDPTEEIFEDDEVLGTIAIPPSYIVDTISIDTDTNAQPAVDDQPLLEIKSAILSRLCGITKPDFQTPIPKHMQTQYTTLHSLLTATISTGESNSLLLLGSRGSGKSWLLSRALADMEHMHGTDFHTVRLNGFFQTDDKLALREIWRQLGREMDIDEAETNETSGSYADTMSSLLSLLCHPDEYTTAAAAADTTDPDLVMQTDQDTRPALDPRVQSRSIIFILDEFDLFTTHPRQTLLYNLFDIAQARKAPIAVLGSSTRMDVVEWLEKRVKSRFSHRWLHVQGPRSIQGFREVLVGDDEGRDGVICVNVEGGVDAGEVGARWNEYIKTTFISSPAIQSLIDRSFYTTKSLPDLFTSLYGAIATLELPAPPDDSTVTTATANKPPTSVIPQPNSTPSLLSLLPTLPTLHLSLLIASSRLDTIHNLPALNFSLAYDHYRDLVTRTKLQHSAGGALAVGGGAGFRLWGEAVAKVAWEALGEWGLLVPVSGREGGGEAVGWEGADVRMWRVDVTLEEAGWALKRENRAGMGEGGGLEVLRKWCREV